MANFSACGDLIDWVLYTVRMSSFFTPPQVVHFPRNATRGECRRAPGGFKAATIYCCMDLPNTNLLTRYDIHRN